MKQIASIKNIKQISCCDQTVVHSQLATFLFCEEGVIKAEPKACEFVAIQENQVFFALNDLSAILPFLFKSDQNRAGIEKLLEENEQFDLNFQIQSENERNTLLHMVCKNGNVSLLQLLIDKGVDINVKNNRNQTPLHLATIQNHVDCVKLLCQQPSLMLNERDINGQTGWNLAGKQTIFSN